MMAYGLAVRSAIAKMYIFSKSTAWAKRIGPTCLLSNILKY